MGRNLNERVKRKMTKLLELPEELVCDLPKIELIGNRQVYVENFKGIVEYGETTIRINIGSHLLKVLGQKLLIHGMTNDDITISGDIKSVTFE